jgi:hypothetical protein
MGCGVGDPPNANKVKKKKKDSKIMYSKLLFADLAYLFVFLGSNL